MSVHLLYQTFSIVLCCSVSVYDSLLCFLASGLPCCFFPLLYSNLHTVWIQLPPPLVSQDPAGFQIPSGRKGHLCPITAVESGRKNCGRIHSSVRDPLHAEWVEGHESQSTGWITRQGCFCLLIRALSFPSSIQLYLYNFLTTHIVSKQLYRRIETRIKK